MFLIEAPWKVKCFWFFLQMLAVYINILQLYMPWKTKTNTKHFNLSLFRFESWTQLLNICYVRASVFQYERLTPKEVFTQMYKK